MAGKVDGAIQCYMPLHFILRPVWGYFVRILVCPQKIPRHLDNGANGVTHVQMAAFSKNFNNNKIFHKKYANA